MKMSTRFWIAVGVLLVGLCWWYMLTKFHSGPYLTLLDLLMMIICVASTGGLFILFCLFLNWGIPKFNNWLDKMDEKNETN